MKPKKRQPLDFSALPEEPPVEALANAAEIAADAPLSEPDFDLDIIAPIADVPEQAPRKSLYESAPAPAAEPISEPFVYAPAPKAPRSRTSLTETAVPSSASIAEAPEDAPPVRAEAAETAAVARPEPPTRAMVEPLIESRRPMPAVVYWMLALAVAAMWAAGPIVFALGYARGVPALKVDGFALLVFGAMAVGPALMTLIGAYMLRQALGVSAELRRTRAMTDRLMTPAALAAAGATGAVDAVRTQIEYAAAAGEEARERMLALRDVLAEETSRLTAAAAESARMATQLSQGLTYEREALEALSSTLDARSTAVVDAIGSQARMVAEASDLAETQLREADAALSARAADLAAAAGEARYAARTAGQDLTRHIARQETAGTGVAEQVRAE
ncbi:MAG: polar localization protein TipN, partial [Caulobacter sp.]|nr:polar localization protein TipN [Caulobacter sp.]